jgi:hypothetical protein
VKVALSFAALFLASHALADEAADRTAIASVIRAVNDHSKPASALLSSDADSSEIARLSNLIPLPPAPPEPLSEVTQPRLVARSIRFITPEVALVDGAIAQFGSVILERSTPVLLVMRKEGADWRIAAVRVMPSPSILAPRSGKEN